MNTPPLLRPAGLHAFVAIAAAMVNALTRVTLVPIFVTPLFDTVLDTGDLAGLTNIFLTAGAVALLGAGALWVQDAFFGIAAAEVASTWRRFLYRTLLRRPPGHLGGSSGGLSNRILTDLREVETYIRFGMGSIVAESLTFIGVIVVLFTTNWKATVTLLVLVAPVALVLRYVGRLVQRTSEDALSHTELIGQHLQEGLKHHNTVRSYEADEFMMHRLAPHDARAVGALTTRSRLAALQTPLVQVLVFFAVAVLVFVLASSVQRGESTLGELVTFVGLVALLATPVQLLPHAYALFRQAQGAEDRLLELAERIEPEVHTRAAPSTSPGLAIHNVSFGYEPGHDVFTNISATLPATGLVALTGRSGTGKSTLLRLLLGFEQPRTGTLTFAGHNLSARLIHPEVRALSAYVPQMYDLLAGSLRDNITLGRAISDDAIWSSLRAVGMAGEVERVLGGLDRELGEDGLGFSGGQMQRIAIARALVAAPKIIILDEPTSNVDEATERDINALLEQLAAEHLVIAVTHRPALVELAHTHLTIDGGLLTVEHQ